SHVRVESAERLEMLIDPFLRVFREPEDVGEMAGDPVLAAETNDLGVLFGRVVELMRRGERGRIERIGSDQDLEAAGPRHALDEVRLAIDLSVALYEKRNPDTFGGDRVGELRSFRNLVEVVGSEEHEPNSGSPRGPQARQCRLDRLAADFVAG